MHTFRTNFENAYPPHRLIYFFNKPNTVIVTDSRRISRNKANNTTIPTYENKLR